MVTFFLTILLGTLVPEMLAYDGESPQSVLVLDNASIHHMQPVADTLKQLGIILLFLPAYSPDLNPIEELFSYIKYYLKDHDFIIQVMQDPQPVLKAAFDSVTEQQCKAWIKHAGY